MVIGLLKILVGLVVGVVGGFVFLGLTLWHMSRTVKEINRAAE